MRDFAILLVHLIVTLARLARPGGLHCIVAESALVSHQLLIPNRGRKRAPNLRATDRIIAGLCTLFVRPEWRKGGMFNSKPVGGQVRFASEDQLSGLSIRFSE